MHFIKKTTPKISPEPHFTMATIALASAERTDMKFNPFKYSPPYPLPLCLFKNLPEPHRLPRAIFWVDSQLRSKLSLDSFICCYFLSHQVDSVRRFLRSVRHTPATKGTFRSTGETVRGFAFKRNSVVGV